MISSIIGYDFTGALINNVVFLVIVAPLLLKFITSYTSKKGKNLATKQDIENITKKIEGVKFEYASSLEDIKSSLSFQALQRDRAEQVAELLVEWISHPEDKRRLNELIIKTTLWLPDKEAKELNGLLAHENNIDVRQVISSIRNFIQGGKTDFGRNDITLFNMKQSLSQSITTLTKEAEKIGPN